MAKPWRDHAEHPLTEQTLQWLFDNEIACIRVKNFATPRAIVTQLNAEINRGLQAPAMTERYSSQGIELTAWTPEAFAAYIQASRTRWAQVISRGNIRLTE